MTSKRCAKGWLYVRRFDFGASGGTFGIPVCFLLKQYCQSAPQMSQRCLLTLPKVIPNLVKMRSKGGWGVKKDVQMRNPIITQQVNQLSGIPYQTKAPDWGAQRTARSGVRTKARRTARSAYNEVWCIPNGDFCVVQPCVFFPQKNMTL